MRFSTYILRFILLVNLCWVASAGAVIVSGMNSADLVVPDRSESTLQTALPQALAQVLIKQSGNPSIMTLPTVQNALSSITQLVQSYAYSTETNNNGQVKLHLQVMFDHRGILHLLREARQAIWGSDRPLTLLWLTLLDTQPSDVLSNAAQTPLQATVLQTAKMRGLPVLLPVMDLQDQRYINTNTAQVFNVEQLQAAAKRYDAPAILAGTLSMSFNRAWQANWLLLLNGQPYGWSDQANDQATLLTAGINKAANMIASQYAVIDNSALQSTVLLEVLDVNNLNDYARLLRYLNQLSSVSQVNLVNLSSSSALLQVNVVGGQQSLVRLLNADQRFAPIPAPLSQGVNRADLYYRLSQSP